MGVRKHIRVKHLEESGELPVEVVLGRVLKDGVGFAGYR